MDAMSFELAYVIEDGPLVTLIGKDSCNGAPAAIQIDLRQGAGLRAMGCAGKTATTYAAQGLRLNLDFITEPASAEVRP